MDISDSRKGLLDVIREKKDDSLKQQSIFIRIGNSDDKLSQRDWSMFVSDVDHLFHSMRKLFYVTVHGRWLSEPSQSWQNACWEIEVSSEDASWDGNGTIFTPHILMTYRLGRLAHKYQQDSIAWTVGLTHLLESIDTPTALEEVC